MGLASLFVDLGALPADCDGGTAVTLVRRYEFDAAVTVAVVVPVHKSHFPLQPPALTPQIESGRVNTRLL